MYIEPGSHWENGYIESFNGKLRDGLLNGEIFTTLLEARVPIENWRRNYTRISPHSALGYRPPVSEVIMPVYEPKGLTLSAVNKWGLVNSILSGLKYYQIFNTESHKFRLLLG